MQTPSVPTAVSPIPTCCTVPPELAGASATAAPAAAIAQSPARRSTFSYALPLRGRTGNRTSSRISSCSTEVSYGPRCRSAIGIVRRPAGPSMTSSAESTSHTVVESSAGSAWQSEPPRVPRLRTTGSAITFSASCRIGKSRPTTGEARIAACRVSAPIRSVSPSCRRYDSSVRSLMSIRQSGRASRSFIIGSRLCPPATRRASGPCCRSRASASATEVARA